MDSEQGVRDAQTRMKAEQAMKVLRYRTLNRMARKGGFLFTGSSLLEQCPVAEMAVSAGLSVPVYHRGIGGTTTDDFLREIDTVLLDLEPARVFLNIGTNDMTDRFFGGAWMDHLTGNYARILRIVKERLSRTRVYCMAYYPANRQLPGSSEPRRWAMLKDRTPENIAECSRRVRALAEASGCVFIDVNEGLYDAQGELKAEYTIDGVHMTPSCSGTCGPGLPKKRRTGQLPRAGRRSDEGL